MVLRLVIALLLITLFHAPANSSNNDSIANRIFTNIYNQQFEKAEKLLTKENNQLNTFYSTIFIIDLHWWKYSTTRSKTDAQKLNNLLKEIEPTETTTQENKIKLLINKSYQLRYERKRYNFFRVISLHSEINQLLSELSRNNLPISGDELKIFDLYMALFKYFEHVNPFSIWRTTPERTKQLLVMEKFTSDKNLIVSTMAHYFLGRIFQKVERKPLKGKTHFEFLSIKFPGNQLFVEHLADCEKKI